ncbi:hypothetical protein BS78_04G109700 [Paspalum vaginatum]|nr:hypothetical protein BS78_04G109700 [Paspalum vaginatum]
MARPSTAAALLLVLSLLAVAHCRPIEDESDPSESNAAVVAVSDENGAENPTLPAEAGASAAKVTVVPPVDEQEQEQHGGFLRLPSQLHRRPCHHGLRHRRHGWVRHQIFFGDAPRRFRSGHGEETREAGEGVKVVAEPDPDRSLPDSDGEGELASAVPSFGDADGEGTAAVRAWRKEMLRRWVHLHSRHHRLRHGEQAAEDEAAVAGEGAKRFHHHRRHHGDEQEDEEKTMRKRFRPAEQHDDDSDDEEVKEMVRRFRKAITRRTRFGHGRRFHHHRHGHGHGEEAEKAGGGEESGVVTWINGLMNRF